MSESPTGPWGRGPVFVVGSMRSGSTLLRLLLDSHPNIAVPPETGFAGGLGAAKQIPQWTFGTGWYERLGWSEEEFDARLHDFYAGLFERYAADQGKPRWGEKTPFHTEHMDQMAQVFPEAVFVGIVRHPGAVASSLRKRFHYTFEEALDYWTATNLAMVRSAARLGGRFGLLRYEDVVVHEEQPLRELVAFLDEPWSDDLTRHQDVQRDKGAPRAVEGSTVTSDPIDPDRARQWAEGLGAPEWAALGSERPADLARFFGYDAVSAEDPAAPTPRGGTLERRWLTTGGELASRRSTWDGPLDFEARPVVAAVDASPQELAARLTRTEQALARTRTRRAVRVADAVRRVQHGRSWSDVRAAWSSIRGGGPT